MLPLTHFGLQPPTGRQLQSALSGVRLLPVLFRCCVNCPMDWDVPLVKECLQEYLHLTLIAMHSYLVLRVGRVGQTYSACCAWLHACIRRINDRSRAQSFALFSVHDTRCRSGKRYSCVKSSVCYRYVKHH